MRSGVGTAALGESCGTRRPKAATSSSSGIVATVTVIPSVEVEAMLPGAAARLGFRSADELVRGPGGIHDLPRRIHSRDRQPGGVENPSWTRTDAWSQ